MDLSSVLPDFHTKPYAHIIPPLERSRISTVDLITLETLEIARRAHVPPADVRRLCAQITKALHHDVGFEDHLDHLDTGEPSSSLNIDTPVSLGPATKLDLSQWATISTLDPALDALLDGGVPTGYLTEVTGESGSGKTQFLLTLLLAVQLPAPRGINKRAIYISTEAPLATPRLSQLIDFHPYLSTLSRDADTLPSLENILSINAMDLESQDHILNYQLPVAISRYNVGLVVIDSITSNYRAEHSSHGLQGLSTRSGELTKLGQMLRNLAAKENIAIVVANQVSDRFEGIEGISGPSHRLLTATAPSSSPLTQYQQLPAATLPLPRSPRPPPPETNNVELSQPTAPPPSSPPIFSSSPYVAEEDPQQQQQFDGSYLVGDPVRSEILSLLHQQRFFTGWGDTPSTQFSSSYPCGLPRQQPQKTPALGLVWSTQITCRIALKKEELSPATDHLLAESHVFEPSPSTASSKVNPTEEKPLGIPEKPPDKEPLSGAKDVVVDEKKEGPEPDPDKPPDLQPQPLPAFQPTDRSVRRSMKLVFAPWAAGSAKEVNFIIGKGGLMSEC
ncbi:P-loop containing nucleoside triphosphate hydrolase protein [Aspergillus ambiguus]|uniref:putative DNA repair protein (Rad57) n=1 Tax=Aspergillus ambiguus TaxID=176160 RepID=UPI003CCC94DA